MLGNISRTPCRLRPTFFFVLELPVHLGKRAPDYSRLASSTPRLGPLEVFKQQEEGLGLKGDAYRVLSKVGDYAMLFVGQEPA